MAQFRATIQGNRGLTSRLGSKQSGMSASINGWNAGINVRAFHRDGQDCFVVELTGGSNDRSSHKIIETFSEDDIAKEWNRN